MANFKKSRGGIKGTNIGGYVAQDLADFLKQFPVKSEALEEALRLYRSALENPRLQEILSGTRTEPDPRDALLVGILSNYSKYLIVGIHTLLLERLFFQAHMNERWSLRAWLRPIRWLKDARNSYAMMARTARGLLGEMEKIEGLLQHLDETRTEVEELVTKRYGWKRLPGRISLRLDQSFFDADVPADADTSKMR